MSTGLAPTAPLQSCLYAGRVTHRRSRPRRHGFGYRVFYLLLDLNELDRLASTVRLFSRDRFNVLSFRSRDHGDGSEVPLHLQVEAMASAAGAAIEGGTIQILCMPRVFGYVFNPLSIYFCRDRTGRLACLVYEVSNTFGQRHSYVIPVNKPMADAADVVRQTCAKSFYVSPFLEMDLTYDFEVTPPGQRVGIAVTARDSAGPLLATAFAGGRRTLSSAAIVGVILAHPFLTMKVVTAIHWEALWLWTKGVKLRPRPPAPADPFTPVAADID